MKIKQLTNERRPVDVSEWTDEATAFVRPFNGFEQLVFNDYAVTFYNKENDAETRFAAAFTAALFSLVDENGASFFAEEDKDVLRGASYVPFFRMFTEGIRTESDGSIETAKKN